MRVGNILYGFNQQCNMYASIMGVFLHACNTPTRVIDALWRLNISISSRSIDLAINSLSNKAEKILKTLGPPMNHAVVLDNFDLQKKHKTPTVEQSTETMFHLTSGSLIQLQHCEPKDLAYSSYLWERSHYNDRSTIQLPPFTIFNLFRLHPETPHASGLTRKEQFMSWLFMNDLCTYGPEYFRQFRSRIAEPDGVEKIPPTKTVQVPLKSMD